MLIVFKLQGIIELALFMVLLDWII